jgi:hypothetical protein
VGKSQALVRIEVTNGPTIELPTSKGIRRIMDQGIEATKSWAVRRGSAFERSMRCGALAVVNKHKGGSTTGRVKAFSASGKRYEVIICSYCGEWLEARLWPFKEEWMKRHRYRNIKWLEEQLAR